METRILFMGPVGAGKTCAIRTISDIETVGTEVRATGDLALTKSSTTVAMDMGVLQLDSHDRVVVYGAPGQERFDFMWDILLAQSEGVLLLLDHSAADPLADLDRYRHFLRARAGQGLPLVLGVTHVDDAGSNALAVYERHLQKDRERCNCALCNPAVLAMDARVKHDVRAALVAMVAVNEMCQRYPDKGCTA